MADELIAGLLWTAVAVGLALFVPPLRSLLGWALGQVWNGLLAAGHLVLTLLQSALRNVITAHLLILKNLGPRNSVLPSVRPKSVKRLD